MSEIDEELLLERAREIVEKTGIKLVDAMIEAETELTKPEDIPTDFVVPIKVKPRVARWILMQFPANKHFTLEERLGAYINTVLARTRVTAMRDLRADATIGEGEAVTVKRSAFQKQVPK